MVLIKARDRVARTISSFPASLPLPGYPINRHEDFEPVFIVGSGRSGTTLVRRILVETGEIHIPPETYVLPEVISKFSMMRPLPWGWLVSMTLADFQFQPTHDSFGIDLAPLAVHLKSAPKGSRSLALILDAVYRYHAQVSGSHAARWGDKTPLNVYALDRIHATFPQARYIHVLRDGCDAVASMLRVGRYGSIDDAAERWSTSVAAARRFMRKHPDRCLEVRYEQLVREPEPGAKECCEFVGLPFQPSVITSTDIITKGGDITALPHHSEVLRPINEGRIGTGGRELDLQDRQRLQARIGDDLANLGYAPCTEGS